MRYGTLNASWCICLTATIAMVGSGCHEETPSGPTAQPGTVSPPVVMQHPQTNPETGTNGEGTTTQGIETHPEPVQPMPMPEPVKPTVPKVNFGETHAATNVLTVGDTLPDFELPDLEGSPHKLSEYLGEKASVVVFWTGEGLSGVYSEDALKDMGHVVLEPFAERGANVIGIAVKSSAEQVQTALTATGAKFPQLLDGEGQAFAKVAKERLPRVYLLGPNREILWFDLVYGEATKKNLTQALHAIFDTEDTSNPKEE